MAIGVAIENLCSAASGRPSRLLSLLLNIEARFDDRASRRTLYRMDDRALADIGLARADVERLNRRSGRGEA